MAETITDILLIAISLVIIIDLSGFVESVKSVIKKWLKINGEVKMKPFDCSFCMTWWTGLIYLIITGNATLLYMTVVLLTAFFTTTILNILVLVKDIMDYTISRITMKLN